MALLKEFKCVRELLLEPQDRNIRSRHTESLQAHIRQGTQVNFTAFDSRLNPFFFSFNQTLLYINNKDSAFNSPILDLLDQYLRSQTPQLYIVSEWEKGQVRCLGVQLSDGLMGFRISAGDSTRDRLFYELLKLCCSLSESFKSLCAFIAYWADRRGILNQQLLPEFALYCMVIEFFQLNNLLPNIFELKYSAWSEDKKQLMRKQLECPVVNEHLLQKQFEPDEYIIVRVKGLKRRDRNQDIFQKVHFHTFPRAQDRDFVRKVWDRQKRQTKKAQNQENFGSLVAKFFHYYSNGKVQKRKIDITKAELPFNSEIGYVVINPIVPGECLTNNLRIRHGGGQRIVPKGYIAVKEEFERAYELLTTCKFQEICEKRKTFIHN